MQDDPPVLPASLPDAPLRGAPLLEHMEALLAQWRPRSRLGEAGSEIPLLTESLPDEASAYVGETPPLPGGISREVFQAHLAVAAERVMLSLYRDLSADLNERIAEELRRAIDSAVTRAVRNLRQQVLVSVAESLTQSIEQTGRDDPGRTEDPPHPKAKP